MTIIVTLDYRGTVPLGQVDVTIGLPYGTELVPDGTDPIWQQESGAAIWTLPSVIPGQRSSGKLELHLFSSLVHDTLHIVESIVSSEQLVSRTEVLTSTVTNDGSTQPPALVPTPTLEQSERLLLPLVLRDHDGDAELGPQRAIRKDRGQLDSRR